MVHGRSILDKWGYIFESTRPLQRSRTPPPLPHTHTHTHTQKYVMLIFLSTAKVVSWKRLHVTLCAHCLSCNTFTLSKLSKIGRMTTV
jgi:hypothetical protein